MNGVCVVWRGWLDLTRLDGVACLDFDADRAAVSTYIVLFTLLYSRIEQLIEWHPVFLYVQDCVYANSFCHVLIAALYHLPG